VGSRHFHDRRIPAGLKYSICRCPRWTCLFERVLSRGCARHVWIAGAGSGKVHLVQQTNLKCNPREMMGAFFSGPVSWPGLALPRREYLALRLLRSRAESLRPTLQHGLKWRLGVEVYTGVVKLEGNRADRPYSSPDWPIHRCVQKVNLAPGSKTNLVHWGPSQTKKTVDHHVLCGIVVPWEILSGDLEG
jgi:hypothetical protein